MLESYVDQRKDRLGKFNYGPRESPDYVEYVPEVFILLDKLFETPLGSSDALKLARLVNDKLRSIVDELSASF